MSEEWSRCSAWIAAALEHSIGGWSVDDLKAAVDRGEMQFWPGDRSAMVTQLEEYPKGRVIEGVACGGDGDELMDVLIPKAEAWAKGEGCVAAHISGRIGWSRRLKASGYAPLFTVICKGL